MLHCIAKSLHATSFTAALRINLYHRRSQRAHAPPPIFRTYSHFVLDRRFSKQNNFIRLKWNILPPQNFRAGYATDMYACKTVSPSCPFRRSQCSLFSKFESVRVAVFLKKKCEPDNLVLSSILLVLCPTSCMSFTSLFKMFSGTPPQADLLS